MTFSSLESLCGVDEAGRGPLAGPVYAGAVLFKNPEGIPGLADSKKLSAKRREALYEQIIQHCWVGVGVASAAEIDQLNILQATFLAMARAVQALPVRPQNILVDGNQQPPFPGFDPSQVKSLIQGDALCPQISAASIVAKVSRDRYMSELDQRYPIYGFKAHSGYPVKAHLLALETFGICPEHRKSFGPVRKVITSL